MLFLSRPQHLLLNGVEKFHPVYAYNAMAFSESAQINGPFISTSMVLFVPCTQKECDDDCHSQDQPCSSPSSCVDAFLTNPLENCDNLVHLIFVQNKLLKCPNLYELTVLVPMKYKGNVARRIFPNCDLFLNFW